MRISAGWIFGGSCVATAATVLNAFVVNKQFYPAIVYLSKSNASMAVLYVQGLVLVYLMFQLLKSILFGDLRAAEAEVNRIFVYTLDKCILYFQHLSERTWHAVLETCLAFTVFRDDFSAIFVMQFIGLLFIKCFHWLADDRVDMMERSPVITLRFHLRMMTVLAALGFADSYFVSSAYFTTITRGASAQIVFGFEYAILLALVLHVTIKYLLHMHDLRNTQSWDNKAVYLLYAELFINLIRCLLYGFFAVIMLRVHTFPLFSVRPFYQSVRALHKAFLDVILSRRAINAMNSQFPVVSSDELAAMDATCIICREEMTVEAAPKRLPCSHVFHAHCLRSWFQRQQTCPTCRTDIWQGRNGAAGANAGDAARNADNNAAGAQPAAGLPPFLPFIGHQFGFPQQAMGVQAGGAQAGGQPGPFPHQIFYAPAPANRPEFMNMMPPPPMAMGGPPGMFPMMPPPPIPQVNGTTGNAEPIIPPANPSYNLLTMEELHRLEGNTRDAIIARLQAMDNIMVLLESAQMQMVQLAAVTPLRRNVVVVNTEVSEEEAPATETVPTDEPTQEAEATSSTTPPQPRSIFRDNSFNTPQPSTSSAPPVPSSPSTSPGPSTSSRTPEAEEVRQRRLARLLGENPNQQS
ncbi:CRE-SEL-11 protein [Caenorhabditis remanei]|uniref:E3 ubiquitin-protein ligase hrd-1 n=1 Tax=Caenorhabditis remanei TaxID=31234 RepID=E3LPR1_CAERE|nr:CRE-SEL-11 protein [Caenorhabditis remanei]